MLSLALNNISITLHKFQETLHNHNTDEKEDQMNESLTAIFSDSEEIVEHNITSTTKNNVLKNWPLMSSIILFCIVSFDDMAYSEVFF